MKGVIFNYLEQMVEEVFGLEVWDAILQKSGASGIYIATDTYDDQELMDLVKASHEISGIPVAELVRSFGEFMFPRFLRANPQFVSSNMTLKSFLLTVDRIIHVEVRKLHPGAILPEFTYEDELDNELTMIYKSPRKLCHLAEGLVAGAAKHFDTAYTLDHPVCMHDGADACTLHLKVIEQ